MRSIYYLLSHGCSNYNMQQHKEYKIMILLFKIICSLIQIYKERTTPLFFVMWIKLNSYINQLLTLYNFSLLYQISSSSCSEFGTGPSRCRSSLDLDKIFRRETISPLLGPQLKYKIMIELLYIQMTFILRTEIMSTG